MKQERVDMEKEEIRNLIKSEIEDSKALDGNIRKSISEEVSENFKPFTKFGMIFMAILTVMGTIGVFTIARGPQGKDGKALLAQKDREGTARRLAQS